MAAGRRRHDHHPACQAARCDEPAVGCRYPGAQADQGGRRGAGQQDGPHRLGSAQARRDLSEASTGSVGEDEVLKSLAG